MNRTLLRLVLGASLAAIAAVAFVRPAGAEDKKAEEKDKKKSEKEREADRKKEEEKRRDEEARKRAEQDWDRLEKNNPGWPEPPDSEEMMDSAKHAAAGAHAGARAEEPKPGVGGYRKPATSDDAEAAAAAGGAFGEGGKDAGGNRDEKKDEKKDEHK